MKLMEKPVIDIVFFNDDIVMKSCGIDECTSVTCNLQGCPEDTCSTFVW